VFGCVFGRVFGWSASLPTHRIARVRPSPMRCRVRRGLPDDPSPQFFVDADRVHSASRLRAHPLGVLPSGSFPDVG